MKGMRPQPLRKAPFSLAPILLFGHKPQIPSKLKPMSAGYESEEMGSPQISESGMSIDGRSVSSNDGHDNSGSHRPGSSMYAFH